MNKRALGADLLLLLTAAIWGFGFVAQRSGMQYVGPFTYNGIRFLLGSLALVPIILYRGGVRGKKGLIRSSIIAGTCLFVAVSVQQLGIMMTTAGNAGFITGLYVVFTPILGIFLGRSTGKATWAGAFITFAGLYFLSLAGSGPGSGSGSIITINIGDALVLVSAVFWAVHVHIIDRLVKKTDSIELSSGQFAVAGLFALVSAFIVEPGLSNWLRSYPELLAGSGGLFNWYSLPALISGLSNGSIPLSLISSAAIPILYGGLVSVGVGYTLQVVAQRYAHPAHATIIMCLEGSFAALGGILILSEPFGQRTLIGFTLMLLGMLISQWKQIRIKN
ncbi:MAG: DMT family transporter [Treponema sp.]|nr:DMT family transporter [Treponema sp.]